MAADRAIDKARLLRNEPTAIAATFDIVAARRQAAEELAEKYGKTVEEVLPYLEP